MLVGTKVDNWKDCKVLNESKKKIKGHEGVYASFGPTSTKSPEIQHLGIDVNGYSKAALEDGMCEPSVGVDDIC